MPNLTNITVKMHDGATNVIFYGIDPGSSQSFSVHKAPALLLNDDTKPEVRVQVRRNGNKEWTIKSWMMFPYATTDTTTGITTVRRRCMGKTDYTVPADVPASTIREFSAQYANFLASAEFRACVNDGGNFI